MLHEILVTWLHAVDLTGLAKYSILQPDSLCCNQRKEITSDLSGVCELQSPEITSLFV